MRQKRICNEIILVLGISLVGLLFYYVISLLTDEDFQQEIHSGWSFMTWVMMDYMFCCLLTAAITIYYWKSRKRTEQERDRYKLMVLDNQLSPHFVLNNFSILASFIEEDQKTAIEFLMSLAKLYRHTLSHIDHLTVPIQEEVEFLKSYIALLEKRFENCIRINIAPEIEHLEGDIPPATLQLLIENAIKHNEHTQTHPLTVNISSHNQSIVVSNIKRPISTTQKGHVGQKNIVERYKLLTTRPVHFNDFDDQYCVTIPIIPQRK